MKGKDNNLFFKINLIISVITFIVYLTTTLVKIIKDGLDLVSRISIVFIFVYALILIICLCGGNKGKIQQKVAAKAISISKKLIKFTRLALSVMYIFAYAKLSWGNVYTFCYTLFDVAVTSLLLYIDLSTVKKALSTASKEKKQSQLCTISQLVEEGKKAYDSQSDELN